jgi:hypothetical protein
MDHRPPHRTLLHAFSEAEEKQEWKFSTRPKRGSARGLSWMPIRGFVPAPLYQRFNAVSALLLDNRESTTTVFQGFPTRQEHKENGHRN